MKIVYTTSLYLPHIGGIELNVHQMAQYFISQGHDVTIIVADKEITELNQYTADNECIIRIPTREIGGIAFPIRKEYFQVIREQINCADVVHLNSTKFLIRYFVKNKEAYHYKLIISSNGWFYHTNKNKLLKDVYFKYIIVNNQASFDHIINISIQDKQIASQHGIKDSDVVFPIVDIQKYSGLKKKGDFSNKFIYFGRIAKNKGILECIKKFANYTDDFIFNIIGTCEDKEYEDELKRIIDLHKMETNIHFLGRLNDEDVRKNIEESDVILMPSLHEGFGITLVECLLSKRIIIANPNDSYIDILRRTDSEKYLFDFSDQNTELMKKIEELQQNEVVPKNVEQFSKESIGKQLQQMYE